MAYGSFHAINRDSSVPTSARPDLDPASLRALALGKRKLEHSVPHQGPDMLVVHIFVHVKPDCIEAFKAATLANARLVDQLAALR